MQHHSRLSGYVGRVVYLRTHWLVNAPSPPTAVCVSEEKIVSQYTPGLIRWKTKDRREGLVCGFNQGPQAPFHDLSDFERKEFELLWVQICYGSDA